MKLASADDVSLQLLSIRLDFNEYYKNKDGRLVAPLTLQRRRKSDQAYFLSKWRFFEDKGAHCFERTNPVEPRDEFLESVEGQALLVQRRSQRRRLIFCCVGWAETSLIRNCQQSLRFHITLCQTLFSIFFILYVERVLLLTHFVHTFGHLRLFYTRGKKGINFFLIVRL